MSQTYDTDVLTTNMLLILLSSPSSLICLNHQFVQERFIWSLLPLSVDAILGGSILFSQLRAQIGNSEHIPVSMPMKLSHTRTHINMHYVCDF